MAKTAVNKKTFRREVVLKFKEETSEALHLEHNLLWCWKLDTAGSISEILGKFCVVVLESREIICSVGVKNEELALQRAKEEWDILHVVKRRKAI